MSIGCGGQNKREKIAASYSAVPQPEPSVLSIPLAIGVAELEGIIDSQLTNLQLGGGTSTDDRRLQVNIKKTGAIQLAVFREEIRYVIPLELDVAYDLTLGTARADGILELDFGSAFTIDSSWHLTTNTQLNAHRWIREPKLRLGLIDLPLNSISNYVIRRSEVALERSIDQAVAQNIALEKYVTDAWNQLQQPILLSQEYQAWLQLEPQDLRMTPLKANELEISATISLEAIPRLSFGGEPPALLPAPFPPFAYDSRPTPDNDFNLRIGTSISYPEAERLASDSVLGETFSSGNRSVQIDSLRLFGQDGKLVVELEASGSYDGSIYLRGIPTYDVRQNRLEIKSLDFTLDTKNLLLKTAGWLLKGKLKRQLQNNLNELLTENLNDLRGQIEAQLANLEVTPGVTIEGTLEELHLGDTFLTPEGIEVVVALRGDLRVNLAGLMQSKPNE